MPEWRGWSGEAHAEASNLFGRATDRSSQYKNYTDAFAAALKSGSAWIGKSRTALLAKADAIDSGPPPAPNEAKEVWKVHTTLIQRTNDRLFSLVAPQ